MREFVELYNLINLIKTITCFKGKGSCIDLLLTNQKCSFKNTTVFETGLSDHHLLIYSMLKTISRKMSEKDRSVKFSWKFSKLWSFETKTAEVLGKHTPRKTKFIRGNHKLHLSKILRKEIMKRSQLKRTANKTGKYIGLYNFRKQRNLVVNVNKKEKKKILCWWKMAVKLFGKLVNLTFRTKECIILSDKGLIFKK